ncbi:MAG: hypothetical protein E7370_03945 [Clostridiales bacterium]|nr:hypothetical protein [Clostridiales bacterium]
MAKQRIDMVALMNIAWDRRCNLSHDEYEEKIKNLLSHSFVEYERLFKAYCDEKGTEYEDEIFYIYQHIFVYIMLSDGDFLQGEYDAYCRYCKWAGIDALSVEDARALYNRLNNDEVANDIALLTNLRGSIDPENYEAMVKGFCYLALAGDKEMDENEYYILRCFFEDGYDYAPKTWEQFKREW